MVDVMLSASLILGGSESGTLSSEETLYLSLRSAFRKLSLHVDMQTLHVLD